MIEIALPCGKLGYLTLENVDSFPGKIPVEVLPIFLCNACPDLRSCKKWNKRRIRALKKDIKEFEKYGFRASPR